MNQITESQVSELEGKLRGRIVRPADGTYAEVTHLASARNVRRPAAIAQCTGVADVQAVVRFARDRDLPFTVIAGRHELNGWGYQDGVLGIDLGPMNGVVVDRARMRGTVQGGARLGQMDRELTAHHVVVPAGTVSDTGVAGLTLGGGIGWLTRKHGATLDNLHAIHTVTADGEIVTASAGENPDLFWAMRGGGGNFAIATSFDFNVHHMDPVIMAGTTVHSREHAADFLRFLNAFMEEAPPEVGNMAIAMRASGPHYPAELQGKVVVVTVLAYCGDLVEGERVLAPLRSYRPVIADSIKPTHFTVLQQIFEGPFVPKYHRRTYQQSGFVPVMTDAFVDEVLACADESPVNDDRASTLTTIEGMAPGWLAQHEDSAAMPRGNARFYWEAIESHRLESEDGEWTNYVKDVMTPRLRRHSGEQAYLNHNLVWPGDEARFIEWAYGPAKYARLQELKGRWDPDNVFRFNKNIPPRAAVAAASAAEGR